VSRGYRAFQADAAQGVVTCPRCHEHFAPLGDGAVSTRAISALDLPAGFPALSASELGDRVRKHAAETERLHGALRERVSDSAFHLWLAPLRLVGAAGDTLYALAPIETLTWLRDRFARVLNEVASALANRPVTVVVGGTT
jgi:hypothetical protein